MCLTEKTQALNLIDMNFKDIEWHDQVLLNIHIDRTNPGEKDIIEFEILLEARKIKVLFKEVYYSQFNLNFGVIADEPIRYAVINDTDTLLAGIKDKWSKLDANIDELKCFEFNLNSTNSGIKIYALTCEICS